MEDPKRRSLRLFGGRLILKIAMATLVPVAVVAGLGFFWEYRVDREVVENVIVNERREDVLALATAIEAATGQADLQTIVANYWRQAMAKPRDSSVSLDHTSASEIFIVDPSGVVLAASSPKLIGQPLVEAMGRGPMGLLAVLREGEAYRSEFTGANGRKLFHASVPLHLDPQDPARVTGAIHLMEPFGPAKRALWPRFWRPPADPCNATCHTVLEYALWGPAWRRAFTVLALALVLGASLTLLLGVVVVAPIRRLREGMHRAKEGLEVTVPVTSRDEIGDLTTSFNQMVTELRRKASTLATLYAIDRTVSQSLDLEVVLTQTLEKICEVMTVEAGGFYLLESDGETLVLRVHRGISPAFAEALGRIRLGEGVSGQAIALRRPVAVDVVDYPTPRLALILVALGIKHMASAPVICRGQVVGAINVGSRRARPFTPEELNLLGSIGQQIGASVENTRLFEQVARAKAEWENTFNAMPDLVAIVDGEYHLVRVNRAMAERFSVAPEDLVGRRCYAVMHGTDAPWPGCPLPQALATGRSASREIEDPHLGGVFLITTSPLFDAEDRAVACVHVVRDITEMKRLEEESRQRQRFEDLSRAKSAFIATMSHELRTPLNSVIGFSELLLENRVAPLTEKQARYLLHINQAGKHLLDLINDILDVSRMEAGKIELKREAVRVDDAVETALALVRPQAAKAGITLGAEIPPGLPPVPADSIRLKQILFNLLSNAVKFTPEGGRITVTARRVTEDRRPGLEPVPGPLSPVGWLEISVTDTGIGIKAEDIQKLFKEFGQLDAGRAPEKRGTGLGLVLTKQLVELHGGRIWVESEGEGRGSVFAFTLPIAQEKSPPSTAKDQAL